MKYFTALTAMLTAQVAIADVHPQEAANITPVEVIVTPSPDLNADELQCMTEAIYFEAGNQNFNGMIAVGMVIKNRVKSSAFPDSVCDVVQQGPRDGSPITRYRCQFTYFCDGKSEELPINDNPDEIRAAQYASIAAEMVLVGAVEDITLGSNHYHAEYVSPNWQDEMTLLAIHGSHFFYTDK